MKDSDLLSKKFVDGRIYFDIYKGKRYLFFDMSEIKGVHDKNGVDILSQFVDFVKNEGKFVEENAVLGQCIIINVSNARSTTEGIRKLKDLMMVAKDNFQGVALKKVAVYGASKIAKIFLSGFNKILGGMINSFDTKEEALEWIAEE